MTTLEIILIVIIWIGYGIFNASQHEFYVEMDNDQGFFVFINIVCAPIAFVVRFFRGMFFWRGEYGE